MPGVEQSRYRDKMHLMWVKLRCRGRTASEIAARFGTTKDDVQRVTNRIRQDDIDCSEDQDVLGAYSFVGSGKRRAKR